MAARKIMWNSHAEGICYTLSFYQITLGLCVLLLLLLLLLVVISLRIRLLLPLLLLSSEIILLAPFTMCFMVNSI